MIKSTIGLLLLASAVAVQAPSVTSREIRLGSGERMFNSIVLTNTHSRAFTDDSRPPAPPPAPPVPNRCTLDEKTPGVIWKIVLRGATAAAKDITVTDDAGHELRQVCWNSSGAVYQIDAVGNRIGGGPQTEFLAAGADNPKSLTFKFGSASAQVILSK